MSTLNRFRDMKQTEVARIHSGMHLLERDGRPPEELVADLVCYCRTSWPEVIQKALRLAAAARRGGE